MPSTPAPSAAPAPSRPDGACQAVAEDVPALPRAGFLTAWAVFWLLMLTVALQQQWREGRPLWEPLLWEGSSAVMASAVVWALWRRMLRLDAMLHSPWRWFAAALRWAPVAAPVFVASIYAIRHGVYALLGKTYVHDAWPAVFLAEMLRFGVFYLLFTAVLFGLRSYQMLSATRLRLEREHALARDAQLLQLAQQIQPHFLFNALNTVASTVHEDPDLAERLLLRLAALLRAATDLARRPESPLAEEVALVQAYAEIMLQRFGDRVELHVVVDPALRACRVPTLSLQPLVENAFRHAVEPRRERTRLSLVAEPSAPGRLRVVVRDDGPGPAATASEGTGLGNLRQRLHSRHGDQASLSLARGEDGRGAVATLELPCAC